GARRPRARRHGLAGRPGRPQALQRDRAPRRRPPPRERRRDMDRCRPRDGPGGGPGVTRPLALVTGASSGIGAATADIEDWRAMYEVNVLGTLRVAQALLPSLVAAEGIIVNVGSTAGRISYEGGAGYTAAKHGLATM